jgi:hypothetical protein
VGARARASSGRITSKGHRRAMAHR